MPKPHKQKEVTLRSGPDPRQPQGTDTVPDLGLPARLGVSTDTVPEQAGVYVPPRPLASAADHRTIEIAPVRLAQDIDPRRAPTELRLAAPPPRRRTKPLFFVLSALLVVAVVGFFAARLAVAPTHQAAPAPPPPPAPVATIAEPPAPPAAPTSASVTVGEPLPTEPVEEAELVPVTPADLGLRSKSPPPAPRATASTPKKKVREPWLE